MPPRPSFVSNLRQRIRPVRIGTNGAAAKAKLDQQNQPQNSHWDFNRQQKHTRTVIATAQAQKRKQVSQSGAAEKEHQQPNRQVSVMQAFYGDGEFRIS